jgi:hypothetical protein
MIYLIIATIIAIILLLLNIPTGKYMVTGGNMEFPYKATLKREDGRPMYNARELFQNLVEYRPTFIKKQFDIASIRKTIPKFEQRYFIEYNGQYLGNLRGNRIVIPDPPNSYEKYQVLADLYNEKPRIKTTGYGALASPYEYFNNPSLHHLWKRDGMTPYEMREALYNVANPEARQGNPHAYRAFYSLFPKPPKVLDFSSAYGDRLLAAIASKVSLYVGVDPWKDLFEGYDAIQRDFPNKFTKMIRSGSETVILDEHNFDFVIMSPAAKDMEPYGSYDEKNKEGQSYAENEEFDDWLINYLFTTLSKAYNLLRDGGTLAITIRDRFGERGGGQIYYTEPTLLYCEAIGFKYVGTIGMESGKRHIFPYWMFEKLPGLRQKSAVQLLRDYYPGIYQRILPTTQQLVHHTSELKTDIYDCTFVNILYPNPTVEVEVERWKLMNEIRKQWKIDMTDYLSRYIMTQKLTYDPVFPYNGNQLDQLHENLKYKKLDTISATLQTTIFKLRGYFYKGITELFNGAIHQLNVAINRKIEPVTFTVSVVGEMVKFDGEVPLSIPVAVYDLMVGKHTGKRDEVDRDVYLVLLRYHTMGWTVNQGTRDGKSAALKAAYGCDFETFGAPFNSYSTYYNSVFHDTDAVFGSYGSFFDGTFRRGRFNTNPPNDPSFIKTVTVALKQMYANTDEEITHFVGLLAWKEGGEPHVKEICDMGQVKRILEINNEKYLSMDPSTGTKHVTKLRALVVILSNVDGFDTESANVLI